MLDKLYRRISGDSLFDTSEEPKEPIIDGMLYRKDYITIIAEEKVGKTIFSQQMAASLSSGTPFLGVLDIQKPMKVWYFATEGRAGDLKDRFIRINNKVEINKNNLTLIPSFFKFNSIEGMTCLEEIINDTEVNNYPDVLFIDSLYSGFAGSLKEDEAVNLFNNTVRQLIEKLGCAIIVVHHMKKNSKDKDGNFYSRTDKDSYGSAFLSAAVDHVFWLEKWKDTSNYPKDRVLRCDTQRGGDIIDSMRLRLVEPDPLYFYQVSKNIENKNKVMKILHSTQDGYCVDKLIKKSNCSRSNVYTVLKELQDDGLVIKYKKPNSRTILYRISEYA